MDSTTAAISKNGEMSEEVAGKIAKLKPDLVIASQAD
jgi:ABC-type Fe3+-hydroxamate transport system substrate-binding protein